MIIGEISIDYVAGKWSTKCPIFQRNFSFNYNKIRKRCSISNFQARLTKYHLDSDIQNESESNENNELLMKTEQLEPSFEAADVLSPGSSILNDSQTAQRSSYSSLSSVMSVIYRRKQRLTTQNRAENH